MDLIENILTGTMRDGEIKHCSDKWYVKQGDTVRQISTDQANHYMSNRSL